VRDIGPIRAGPSAKRATPGRRDPLAEGMMAVVETFEGLTAIQNVHYLCTIVFIYPPERSTNEA